METFVRLTFAALALTFIATFVHGCGDNHSMCSLWAMAGECYKNRGYMHVRCAQSCHQCNVQDELCKDDHEQCAAWAHNGECRVNYNYMRKACARSCTFCTPASDHSVPHIHANLVDSMWDGYKSKYPGLPIPHHGS